MAFSLFAKLHPKHKIPIFPLTHFAAAAAFPDPPTSAYYDDVITSAGRRGDFETVLQLLNKRFHDGCFNTADTFKFLTNTQNSISTLQTLIDTLSRVDTGFARKSSFDSLVYRLCKLGRVDEAWRVLETLARAKYGINAVSFHPLLNALTRKKEMERARRVVEGMRGINVKVDVTSYNYLLTGCCFNKNLEGACEVLEAMEKEGLSGDTRTYDALVLGACRAGKVEGALSVLRRMEDDGLPVLYSTYAHVINAMLKKGYYAQAVKFVGIYGGRDRALDEENYGLLGRKLIGLGRFDEAKVVLEEMDKLGLEMGSQLGEAHFKSVQ